MPHEISPRYAPVCERIHWVVVGGESGPGARPCGLEWIRALRDECKQAQVACFIKQLGARPMEYVITKIGTDAYGNTDDDGALTALKFNNRKGGDMAEFPADLHVREWPEVRPC